MNAAPLNSLQVPLCVDLDGTLTPIDTLHESLLTLVRKSPGTLFSLPGWVGRGKSQFKRHVADRVTFDPSAVPVRAELLEWLNEQRSGGRTIVLATAADRSIAAAIAAHLGCFDDVIASDGERNLSGEDKRRVLVDRFGEKGFDYIGNERKDEAVWKSAREAIVVGSESVAEGARKVAEVSRVFPVEKGSLRVWLKAIRIHQWVKNLLIFLPALLAHAILKPGVLLTSVMAFVAFGLCASSVYILNDLVDLASDRRHPRKRKRPFASGVLPATQGLAASVVLIVGAAVIAASLNLLFCGVLAGYYVLTWAYSLRLKRAALVDVMTLAGLYTIRIIAGSAATLIPPSFWLLAFSVFTFLSLGVVKRYTELYDAGPGFKRGSHGRGYSFEDLPLLMALGTASGFSSVVVMALYLNSPDSQVLYSHNKPLWLVCPLMLYWISRVWLLATRGQMHDDPVVFAIKDRISLLVFAILGGIVMISI